MERREQILEAAIKVFAERGYERATNALIAQEAGISPGLIYWYFDNKEALFVEATRSRVSRVFGHFKAVLDDSPPEEALSRLAEVYLAYFQVEEHARLSRMFLREVGKVPAVDAAFGEALMDFVGGVASYIARQTAAGHFREVNAPIAAQMFIGSLLSFALRHTIMRFEPLPIPVEDAADTVVSIFLKGLEKQ